jgi:hypothetical protein
VSSAVWIRPKWLGDRWLIVALAVLLAGSLRLLVKVISYRHLSMDMDEAVHARDGQEYAHALRAFGSGEGWGLLSRPQWHPPAHGLLLGGWFTVFKSSVLTARLYSVLCYFLLGLVVLRSTRTVCKRAGSVALVWAAVLFVSDSTRAETGGLAMLEAPAELFAALALLFFVEASSRDGRQAILWHAAATAVALLTFFTRYAHGLVVMVALAGAHAVAVAGAVRVRQPRRLLAPAIFALTSTLGTSVWLFAFGQIRWLRSYSSAQPTTVERWSLENLSYYPRLLWESTPLGPLVLVAFVVTIAVAARRRQLDASVLPYLFYLSFAFLMLFFVKQKEARFGLMLNVPLWLSTLGVADPVIASILNEKPRRALVGTAVATIVALVFYYRDPFPAAYENYDGGLERAYEKIAGAIKPWQRGHSRIVLFGRDDSRSGVALAFALTSACDRRGTPCSVRVEDEADIKRGWPRGSVPRSGAAARQERALSRATHVVSYRKTGPSISDFRPLLDDEVTYKPNRRGNVVLPIRVFHRTDANRIHHEGA